MTIAVALLAMGAGQASALTQEVPGTGVVITTDQFIGPVSWVWLVPEIIGEVQDFGVLEYSVTCVRDSNSVNICNGELLYQGPLGAAECIMEDDVVRGTIFFTPTGDFDNCVDMDWSSPTSPTDPGVRGLCIGTAKAFGNRISGQGGGLGLGSC